MVDKKPRYVDVGKPLIIPMTETLRFVLQMKENTGKQRKFWELRKEIFSKRQLKFVSLYKSGWIIHLPNDKAFLGVLFSTKEGKNKVNEHMAREWGVLKHNNTLI